MDRLDLGADAHNEPAAFAQNAVLSQQRQLGDSAGKQVLLVAAGKDLESQNKLGKLSLVESAARSTGNDAEERDSDHLDVGSQLSWSRKAREHARPQPGQGYYDVMKSV
ncbi:MAG: hypothetical protein K2X81_09155, partial [Candidatus Obscuribacterales bacterium]|nr:hypothetical protein [Candidatus Obscuribacterales bacterium]